MPGPLVLDGQRRPGPGRHRHAAARRGVPDGVVHEDRGQLPEPRLVPADRGGRDLEHEPHAAFGRHGLERLRRLRRGVREIGIGHGELDGLGVGPGEEQQVRDEVLHPRRTGVQIFDRPVDRGRVVAPAPQLRDRGPRDRERRPELVACVGGELALALERLADRHQRATRVHVARPRRTRPGRRGRRRAGR